MATPKKHFFDSLPALLGAIAAVITAVAGFLVAWSQWGGGTSEQVTTNNAAEGVVATNTSDQVSNTISQNKSSETATSATDTVSNTVAPVLVYVGAGEVIGSRPPFARMYSGPGTEFPEMLRVNTGTRVEIGNLRDSWFPVRLANGESGYIHRRSIRPLSADRTQ